MPSSSTISTSSVGIVASPAFQEHLTGHGHPERPERLQAIEQRLREDGLMQRLLPIGPRECTLEQAALCHTREYLATAEHDIVSGRKTLSTGDTQVSAESWRIARLAAGGVLAAVDAVMEDRARHVFCAIRPPGHHATPTQGMGFCVLGNVAMAAKYAQSVHGIEKVLIVDWDVHHGNGTQDAFYEDDSVLFFSTHQHPWYPGTGMIEETGTGRGLGTTINAPLPAKSGRKEIFDAFEQRLLPAVAAFRPQLILISAGFDSRRGDPLGEFQLDDPDFAELTSLLMGLAREHTEGRLVSVLEGGYSLEGVASGVSTHVRTLLGSSGLETDPVPDGGK